MTTPRSVWVSCPMDCFDLCRFKVFIDGNRVTGIRGDKDHPLTRGVICKKGRALLERLTHPQRLTTPLVKENGAFMPAGYDQILDRVAQTLTDIKEKYGNTAVLNYTSDGYGGMKGRIQTIFFNRFGGDSRFTGSLCWSAGQAATKYDFGMARGHLPNDVLNSKLVLVWGRNPKVTNLHFYTLLKQAEKSNTRVIVIDPIRTETAKAFDDHIQIAPATDGALALAMAHVMIRDNLYDADFVTRHVKGFKRLAAYAQGFPPETAAPITGLDAHTIEALAVQYATSAPSAIWMGYGLQRHASGGNAVRCINALGAISGHMGKPGGGVNYAAKSLAPLLNTPEKNSLTHATATRTFPVPYLGSFLETADTPPIKAAFVTSGNPLNQSPDLNHTIRAFKQVPFKVVFDHFMTDTARHADIVLPAPSVFEQTDLFTTSMYSHVLNYSQKALDPPDTLMPEFEFYLALAKRLDLDLGFEDSDDYLGQCAAPLLSHLGMDPNTDLDDLAGQYIRIPHHDIAWQDMDFPTPSGKIELFSEKAAIDGHSPLPEFTPPAQGSAKFPLRLLTCKTAKSLHSQGFAFTDEIPECRVNQKTALKLGIKGEETVKIASPRGEITAQLTVDESIYDNTAFMHQGWWHKSGAVNFLTDAGLTDMGEQAAYYETFCTLLPLPV